MFNCGQLTLAGSGKEKVFSFLNGVIPLLTGIYIFFNPFPHTTAIKELCFYISVLALIALIIFKKTGFSFRSPLSPSFLLFFLWGVFGLFFTLDIANSFHDLWAHFLKYVMVYFLLVNYFHLQKRLEIFSWVVVVSATIFSLWAIIIYYIVDGNPLSARLGVTFLEIHTDYIGFILIFALILTLNKLLHHQSTLASSSLLISSIILCATTLLTQSRGALIALVAAIIILSFLNKKILVLLAIIILLVMTIPGFKERMNIKELLHNERRQINALTMEIIKSYPLTGLGFGMQIYGNTKLTDLKKFDSKLPKQYQGGVGGMFIGSPHNTLLDVAVRTGIIGFILFSSIIVTALFMLWRAWQVAKDEYFKSWIVCVFAAFLSFMIAALFADTAFGPQAVVFYTILAMITILWNINKSATNARESQEHS